MARHRIAVALVVDGIVGHEVDGIRRALGDRQLDRIAPHVTLVPPINLRTPDRDDAIDLVRDAAARSEPIDLTLGPVATFAPRNPTRFLEVTPHGPVAALAETCRTGVLDRPRRHDFHPHVTVDIGGGTLEIPDPAVELLAGYRREWKANRVHVLGLVGERPNQRWVPVAGFHLGCSAVIGRGGIEVALTGVDRLEPAVLDRLGPDDEARDRSASVVARIDGIPVAVCSGPSADDVKMIGDPPVDVDRHLHIAWIEWFGSS